MIACNWYYHANCRRLAAAKTLRLFSIMHSRYDAAATPSQSVTLVTGRLLLHAPNTTEPKGEKGS